MLEIRKGTASKNYENTFFREFAENLKNVFDKYSLDGLLIANSECEVESRLQIDALLVTQKTVCIIDFKNFGGKITLPKNAKSEFDFGRWTNEKGEIIKGGSSINPFVQLKNQKDRFTKVVESQILDKLPQIDCFNPYHTVRIVCFQKQIELIGSIPPKEELNFFIIEKNNYLEKIKDIIDISDKEVNLSKESFNVFKEIFRADQFDIFEDYDNKNFTTYETNLDFEHLYPDQKSALSEVQSFIKSDNEKFFVLQGTSLSGKTHLIPFIKDVAFNNQISEVKLFASSGRVANNLLKNTNLPFDSIYSYIYGGNINTETEDSKEDETADDVLNLEIVPLKKSDDTEESIFIVDESHLISDNYHQSIDLRFGSGKLLKDFIEFADLKNSKRKIIFIGDSYQLSIGKKEESALNPEYLANEYEFSTKAFQLIDKEDKSLIVREALKSVDCIRQQSFNNLSFNFSDSTCSITKENLKSEIENSLKSNKNSHILCFSNSDAQKVNFWIKNSIIKNGNDLNKGDLIVFGNNIRVEDENDPFAEPKKIYNGQFGSIIDFSDPIIKREKLLTPLTFRKTTIQLQESNHILTFLSLENFRLNEKGELSKEEIISFKILLNQLAEEEIENFKSGKYHIDEELKNLLDKYDSKTRKGISKLRKCIQKHLQTRPSSNYYKYKNVAQMRFGWALTVHKAMSYKWKEIFLNVETGTGKTNETYFKWIYTGLIRATQKVNLINYEPITPFSKSEINPTIPKVEKGKEFFYISDIQADLSVLNKEIAEKYKFQESESKSSLLQFFQFIESKLSKKHLIINSINHSNYQELYEIKGAHGEIATISTYYNKKGQFNMPSLMKSQPKEFGIEVLNLLQTENKISDFEFIHQIWRKKAYYNLNEKFELKNLSIGYIIQTPFKDTIQINKSNDTLLVDMYYDGDGFFSAIIASSCTEMELWSAFQDIINELKTN
ncbi:NERD domain-containing protein/DEAD/DEAH box helicase [Dysgonomonas sp. ZJ279]|uniref:NERD domain-containing protein/DEAD/DEAH box helicase n=1 Tax=Dysgonomonas sp. ZJ279 TaxID=2709796 RepID=UPI0013ED253E|nr:NERD domain-containing protein/DEAD/DEAH box helicase [Dysgonomonas sp. ZJ279]